MKLFLGVIAACYATGLAGPSFRYENMHKFGSGRRAIQNYRSLLTGQGYEYPKPLPSTKVPDIALVRQPYRRVYQGMRRDSLDERIFKKSFEYPPTDIGQRILCESLVDCKITFMAIETREGIPTILRGGVGYQHFTVIVRAKPGDALKGTIRVYCNKKEKEESSFK